MCEVEIAILMLLFFLRTFHSIHFGALSSLCVCVRLNLISARTYTCMLYILHRCIIQYTKVASYIAVSSNEATLHFLMLTGDALNKSCADGSGIIIPHGQTFMPNVNDPCHICKCDNSFPILCHTAVCSPPPGCVRIEQIPKECCQYHCYDADGNNLKQPDKNVSATDDGSSAGGKSLARCFYLLHMYYVLPANMRGH